MPISRTRFACVIVHQHVEKLALKRGNIDGGKAGLSRLAASAAIEMRVGGSEQIAEVVINRGPQLVLWGTFAGGIYFSRATTKSGTQSRARLKSVSASGASAWRDCSA